MSNEETVNSSVIEKKDELRRQLAADAEAFLAKGGKIQEVHSGATRGADKFTDFSINSGRDSARRDDLNKLKEVKTKAPRNEVVDARVYLVAGQQKKEKTKPAAAAKPPIATALPAADIRHDVQQGFKKKGTTLNKWCKENNVCAVRVSSVLRICKGKKSQALRQRVLDALASLPDLTAVTSMPASPTELKHQAATVGPATMGLREMLEWWIERERTTGHPIYVHQDRLMAALVKRG